MEVRIRIKPRHSSPSRKGSEPQVTLLCVVEVRVALSWSGCCQGLFGWSSLREAGAGSGAELDPEGGVDPIKVGPEVSQDMCRLRLDFLLVLPSGVGLELGGLD